MRGFKNQGIDCLGLEYSCCEIISGSFPSFFKVSLAIQRILLLSLVLAIRVISGMASRASGVCRQFGSINSKVVSALSRISELLLIRAMTRSGITRFAPSIFHHCFAIFFKTLSAILRML